MNPAVDILLWGQACDWDWPLGNRIYAPELEANDGPALLQYMRQAKGTHLLCWHAEQGPPPLELIQRLAESPLDVWHGGLKRGMKGQPHALDLLEPTWIYHKDGPEDQIQSSFRISLRACLLRRHWLDAYIGSDPRYDQIDALGLDLGFYGWKQGALMRYHPALAPGTSHPGDSIRADQQWIFVRRFYGRKWRLWYALGKGNRLKNVLELFKAPAKPLSLRPGIHPSDPNLRAQVPVTISVLAPTLDRYPYLERELVQLNAQTLPPYEILVTDQTPKSHRKQPDYDRPVPLRYFPQEETGQCLAWNKLLEEARGEWVLFLGDDADHIGEDFLDRLVGVQQYYQADMVAAFVEEAGIDYRPQKPFRYMSDSFPICLVRKSLLEETGYMDMFFNRTIRADHDLAMRCHLAGALMIFDSGIRVFHHRAPVGGLRTHKARVITRHMSRRSWRVFVGPTVSEIYLAAKYFPWPQVRNYLWIKYLGQASLEGPWHLKLLRLVAFTFHIPRFMREYRQRSKEARAALNHKGLAK